MEVNSPSPERGPDRGVAAAADQSFYQVAPYQPPKGETPRRPRFLPNRAGEAAPGTVPDLLGLPPCFVTLWNLCFGPETVIGYLSKSIISGGILAIPRILNYGVLFLLVLSFMGFVAYPTQAATMVGSWLRAGPHMVWSSFQEFLQALFWDLAGFSWSPNLNADTCTCSPNAAASAHRGPLHGLAGGATPRRRPQTAAPSWPSPRSSQPSSSTCGVGHRASAVCKALGSGCCYSVATPLSVAAPRLDGWLRPRLANSGEMDVRIATLRKIKRLS